MQNKKILSYKKIILFILPILLVPSISFGESGECLVCGSSPKEFVLINDFTTEMLGQIRTIGTSGKYTGKFVPPSRFENGDFRPPQRGVVSKILRRAKESLDMSLGIGNIFQQLGNPISIADELIILTRNEVFFREWKKISQIETAINKKKYELAMGGGRTDEIKGVPKQRMQSILDNYKSEGIIEDYSFDGAKYYEILVVLGAINNDMKHMIAIGGTQMLKSDDSSSFSSKFNVNISDKSINNMKSEYKCALWLKCQNQLSQFKGLGKSIKSGGSSAREEISKAHDRLKEAISSFGKDVKKRYNDMIKKSKKIWNDFTDETSDNMQEIGDTRSQPFSNRRLQKLNSDQKTLGLTDKPENNVQTTEINNEQFKSDFENTLENNIANIIAEAKNMDDSLIMSSVDDITPYFSELTYKISNLTKNIIGAKGQENTLIDNLGQICEKQCTNVGNKKCYY